MEDMRGVERNRKTREDRVDIDSQSPSGQTAVENDLSFIREASNCSYLSEIGLEQC